MKFTQIHMSLEPLSNRLKQTADDWKTIDKDAELDAELASKTLELVKEAEKSKTNVLNEAKEQLDFLYETVQDFVEGNEQAQQISDVLSSVRNRLAQLKEQVAVTATATAAGAAAGVTGSKNIFEKIFGGFDMKKFDIGSMYKKITTSIAFSFGSMLKSLQGVKFMGMETILKPIYAIVGADRIELAGALKDNGFEGIDSSKGSLGSVTTVRKRRFPKVPADVFYARLAKEARNQSGVEQTITFANLASIAETLDFTDLDTAKEPETVAENKEQAPLTEADLPAEITFDQIKDGQEITVGPYTFSMVVSPPQIRVNEKKWQLKSKSVLGSLFSAVADLSIVNAHLDKDGLFIDVGVQDGTIQRNKLPSLLRKLATESADINIPKKDGSSSTSFLVLQS